MQLVEVFATSRKVAGSIPDSNIGIFHWLKPSDRIMAVRSTQPVTEMTARDITWGVKADGAYGWQPCHLHVSIILKCWDRQPLGAVRACPGFYRNYFTFKRKERNHPEDFGLRKCWNGSEVNQMRYLGDLTCWKYGSVTISCKHWNNIRVVKQEEVRWLEEILPSVENMWLIWLRKGTGRALVNAVMNPRVP